MARDHLIRVPKVDRNGKQTTVLVNPDKDKKGGASDGRNAALRSASVPSSAGEFEAPAVNNITVYRLKPEDNHGMIDDSPLASEYVDEYLQGGDYSSEPIYARSDYANVGESGIAYGVTIRDDYIGQVFAGRKRDGETDEEYSERCQNEANIRNALEVIAKHYGAEAVEGGDEYTNIEFFVEYPGEDPSTVSLAVMGNMVEDKTRLLAVRNAYDYGSELQNIVAKEFGYEWRLTDDANRQAGDGYWVKKED